MNKADIEQAEIERFLCISILKETMEKLGYRCIYTKTEWRWSYQEQKQMLTDCQRTFVPHTMERNSLSSISHAVENWIAESMKLLKKSKMDWSLTTDTPESVEISVGFW